MIEIKVSNDSRTNQISTIDIQTSIHWMWATLQWVLDSSLTDKVRTLTNRMTYKSLFATAIA